MKIQVKTRSMMCEYCDPISRSIHTVRVNLPFKIKNTEHFAIEFIKRAYKGVLINHGDVETTCRLYDISDDDFDDLVNRTVIREVVKDEHSRTDN